MASEPPSRARTHFSTNKSATLLPILQSSISSFIQVLRAAFDKAPLISTYSAPTFELFLNKALHVNAGMEGYAMYLLGKYGDSQPWSAEEVQVFPVKVRKGMEKGYHCYLTFRRVYAWKPLEG